MIIDSHAHAWQTYPYRQPVPDPHSRTRVEQLIYEMNSCGVDRAILITASIDRNPDNNMYVADAVIQFPERLYHFPDVDCEWSSTYHTQGAASRLEETIHRWQQYNQRDSYCLKGFTHYLAYQDEGDWLYSSEGLDFFRTAAECQLILSICCYPHQHKALRKMAEKVPNLPILVHHLGLVKANETPPRSQLQQVLESAQLPNIYVKISGFGYASSVKWGFPYQDVTPIVLEIYEKYGPYRMCWGSDYPVVRDFMTYRQSLEVFRSFYSAIPEQDKEWILGKTILKLLSPAE